MRKWLHDRPWIWIVLLLAFLVAVDLALVAIAVKNAPVVVGWRCRDGAPPGASAKETPIENRILFVGRSIGLRA